MSLLAPYLRALIDSGGSDLHISVGAPPYVRVAGKVQPVPGVAVLTAADMQNMLFSMLTQTQQGMLQQRNEFDFSFGVEGHGRFRCNIHRQRSTWAAAFRKIPNAIPTLEQLGLPEAVLDLALRPTGLVLITGPTGSGKSLTMAAMIDAINENRECHVITLEDPIEFIFTNKKALIKQREIGTDTESFEAALHHTFRQDPDVIMIGEIRTADTIMHAVTSANSGRLVIGTLHTMDAASTIDRLIESAPADQQGLLRTQVAGCLEGIVSQQLVKRADDKGRVLAIEILTSTPSIRNLIRTGKTPQIANDIETGKRFGMQTIDQSLHALVVAGTVKLEDALKHTRAPDRLLQMVNHAR